MRARSGLQRGFSRLSDKFGGIDLSALVEFSTVEVTATGSGSTPVPAGAMLGRVVGLAAGGSTSNQVSNGEGAGGGSGCEAIFPCAPGQTISYSIGVGAVYANPDADGGQTTIDIPGFSRITLPGGTRRSAGARGGVRGTGGPPGTRFYAGGNGAAGSGNPPAVGEAPLATALRNASGGGWGGGPIGGAGATTAGGAKLGGGGVTPNAKGGDGALLITFYGLPE